MVSREHIEELFEELKQELAMRHKHIEFRPFDFETLREAGYSLANYDPEILRLV